MRGAGLVRFTLDPAGGETHFYKRFFLAIRQVIPPQMPAADFCRLLLSRVHQRNCSSGAGGRLGKVHENCGRVGESGSRKLVLARRYDTKELEHQLITFIIYYVRIFIMASDKTICSRLRKLSTTNSVQLVCKSTI